MWINFFGAVNSFFILMSLLGILAQWRTIQQRKRRGESQVTYLLSQKMFMVSFMAYFLFYVYGMSIEPFNHFIVWPRLIASLLVLAILYDMWRDRRTLPAGFCLGASCILLLGSGAFAIWGLRYQDEGKELMTLLIVSITILLAHGYSHQIVMVIRNADTGALDKKMSQFILLMDISTIAFALSLGLADAWPLFLLATVSGLTKVIILYLFYWVNLPHNKKPTCDSH